jgi:quaternary ammonium compound-resistance protein SugE
VIQVGPFFLAPMDEEYVRDMKVIAFYAVAAALYVAGGTFMKYSQGLTRLLPSLALVMLFSAGALLQAWAMKHEALGPSYVVVLGLEALLAVVAGSVIFTEPVTVKIFCGVALVVLGIILLRMA